MKQVGVFGIGGGGVDWRELGHNVAVVASEVAFVLPFTFPQALVAEQPQKTRNISKTLTRLQTSDIHNRFSKHKSNHYQDAHAQADQLLT